MKLFTVAVDGVPIVVLSVDAELGLPDQFARDPQALSALRAMAATTKSMPPGTSDIEQQMEIEDALDTWLGDDLLQIERNGQPLWDGNRDRLRISEALADEADHWRAAYRDALVRGEQDAGDESFLVFIADAQLRERSK